MNQYRSVTASAPGKLMLLGEHAVVYGYPCLVSAVDLRVKVTVRQRRDSIVEIFPSSLDAGQSYQITVMDLMHKAKDYRKETAFVEAAIGEVFKKYQITSGLSISTQGPKSSYGLGSSSAVTVATMTALNKLFDLELDSLELFNLSYSAVLAVQGTGSGFDIASAVHGGTIYFVSSRAEIKPVAVENIPIIIGYSGRKASTCSYIAKVAELRTHHRGLVDSIFGLIGDVVEEAKSCLLQGNWELLGQLVNINQGLLDALGINTPQLAHPIFAARKAGALGAKLSGAGGGDCMFALVNSHHQVLVEQAIQQAGAELVPIKLDPTGAKIEACN